MAVDSPQLVQTLIESFNALADEVQHLVDRKIILEAKMRWSHEQASAQFFPCYSCVCVVFLFERVQRPAST